MRISQETLRDAVSRGVLTAQEASALWAHLEAEQPHPMASSTGAPVATLHRLAPAWQQAAAALAVALVSAATFRFAFDRFGFAGLAITAAALSAALLVAGRHRHLKSGGRLGQVFLSAAVLLVPVAVHGLVRAIDYQSPWVGSALTDWLLGPWFPVQATAVAAAALGLRAWRIPFLSAVLAGAAWFAAQDACPVLFGDDPSWSERALVSSLIGLVVLAAGLAVDRRTREDHASWLYACGLLALCGGLTTMHSESDASIALVALLQVVLVAISLLLERRSFAVAGRSAWPPRVATSPTTCSTPRRSPSPSRPSRWPSSASAWPTTSTTGDWRAGRRGWSRHGCAGCCRPAPGPARPGAEG
jgi:hypothetical protein